MSMFSLILTFLFCCSSFAQFEEITISRLKDRQGRTHLCLKQFMKPDLKCVRVEPWSGSDVNSTDSTLNITNLALVEFSLSTAGKDNVAEFGAVIRWEGKGAGSLAISGPKGQIFAVGRVFGSEVVLDQFSDESLSQQFDRAVLFGESDVFRLHAATKIWLENLLKPAVSEYLAKNRLP